MDYTIEKHVRLVILGAALLFLSSGTIPVQADNGSIALAVPVAGITVDGDLSDWPEELVRYPIRRFEFGGVSKSAADFEADFRIGYSRAENALYVAVEVQDESIVVVEDGGTWDDQDGCDVFVKASHAEGETEQRAWQHAVWGDQRQVIGPRDAVDRAAGVELGISRSSAGHRYEWRLPTLDDEAEPVELRAGSVLSFDVSVGDKDRDGSFSWIAWGRGSSKLAFDDRRGDLLLVEDAAALGRLEGRIVWQGRGITQRQARIQSTNDAGFRLMAEADAEGRFATDVPAGRYRVQVVGQDDAGEGIEVDVDPASVHQVELLVSTRRGEGVAETRPSAPVGAALGRGAWQTFGLPDGLLSPMITDIIQDRRGHLWLATGLGVSRYDGETFTAFTAADGLVGNTVRAILEDSRGHLWFGGDGGVSRYDGESFVSFSEQEGLAGADVYSILEDSQGHLWFGTSGGVSRYDGESFTTVAAAEDLGCPMVQDVLEDEQGHLWFATGSVGGVSGRGVSRFDGERFVSFTAADGLGGNEVLSLFEDRQGYLWFGTMRSGVSRYDGGRFALLTRADGLVDDDVRAIEEDSRGHLWFATGRGVSRYDGEGMDTFSEDGQGEPVTPVHEIVEDDGSDIWIGVGYGVTRFEPGSGGSVVMTAADGLGGDIVRDLLQDGRGNIWIATENGVSRYDGHQFVNFTPEDGLAYRDAVELLEDRQGHLWIATTGGISRYDGQVFHTLYLGDLLARYDIRDLLQDSRGNIWIATENGVARYRPYYGPLAISLNIVADREYGAVSQLTLPASQRFLAFEFSGERLVKPGKAMIYRYRLEGYDAGWRQTHAGRAEYRDLDPGDYTFAVEAIDNDLNYSERLRVRLKVLPPWYKTPATMALLSMIVLGVAGGLLVVGRRYIGQRREAARMRQQQLALYRVREQVWQMMDSADIDSLVASAAENLLDLGVRFSFFGVNVIDPRAVDRVTCYTLAQDGEWLYHGAEGHPLIIDFWRNQEVVYRPDLHRADPYGEREVGSGETETSSAEDSGIRQKLAGAMAEGTLRSVIDVPFSHGTLAASSTKAETFSEEDSGILQEFARVLSEGFRRMDDLRALERRRQELEEEISERTQAEEEAKGEGGGGGSQPGEERLPGQYEPRDPHADERHPRVRPDSAGGCQSHRQSAPRRGDHRAQRRPPAGADQRHTRHHQDRGRAPGVQPDRFRPAVVHRGPFHHVRTALPAEGIGLAGAERFAASPGARGRKQAAPGADQPAGQRRQVHRPGEGRADRRRAGGGTVLLFRGRHRTGDRARVSAGDLRTLPAGDSRRRQGRDRAGVDHRAAPSGVDGWAAGTGINGG